MSKYRREMRQSKPLPTRHTKSRSGHWVVGGAQMLVDEVQAPALVGKRQHRRRCPRADGAPSSLPATHRQPFLAIQPLRLLAVDGDTVPAKQDMQAAITEPPTLLRQLAQARPQVAIIRPA